MTSDMRLEFIQDKGVFSTFNLPYEKFNGLKVKGYSEQCTYFTVSTVDAEDDGFTCKTEYEKLFSAILSNGKKVFVNRFEGVAINLETGKKMNVSNAVFRLKTSY